MAWYFALPLYWLILFVVCYIVAEYSQNYLYDETTPALPAKLAGGTLLLAILLTIFRTSFDTMFTDQIHWSLLQGIAWFLVFMFIFRFHPKHAVALGVATFVVVAGMATLGIDSLSGSTAAQTRAIRKPSKPLRRPTTSFSAPGAEPSKEGEKPAETAGETGAPAQAK